MSGTLSIRNRQRTRPLRTRCLRRLAQGLLRDLLQRDQFNLGICVVDAREMARLNETFLRHRGATDVIAFDYSESKVTLHGEIFLCIDEAVAQARRFRTTWPSELVRYLVHGVLHLLGHDDARRAARRRMKREEDRLLKRLAHRFDLSELARVPSAKP